MYTYKGFLLVRDFSSRLLLMTMIEVVIEFVWRDTSTVSQVKSSHLYLYSAFNNTNCNKALHNTKIGKLRQQCKMTGFNTQPPAECTSPPNPATAPSSPVQPKQYLCNQTA